MMSNRALIYAELLGNIGQISVIAVLPTLSAHETQTQVELSKDGEILTISHAGISNSIKLPARAATTYVLPAPALGLQEVSWRIPLEQAVVPNTGVDFADTVVAPWSASYLSKDDILSCRVCDTVILYDNKITTWKDLPSENWAEMMDFWHCHKPNDHKKDASSGEKDLVEKGYGANTAFKAKSGLCFVDLTYLLLSKEDCTAVIDVLPDPSSSKAPTLACYTCHSHIGTVDSLASGYRFYKWSLSISSYEPSRMDMVDPPRSVFLAAHLLSQIASQAVHKFVIHAPAWGGAILYIWVFAPKLLVSFSNSPDEKKPIPAMKTFYQRITETQRQDLLDNSSFTVEEILLSKEVMKDLSETLVQSTASLPPSARKFREWDVGLLERFVEPE